ncbi:MAG: hypothetical protein ACR2ND_11650, partial [Solirubrobacteraceae bacterium]
LHAARLVDPAQPAAADPHHARGGELPATRPASRRPRFAAPAFALVAAAAAAAFVAATAHGPPAPKISDVASLASRPAIAAAPPESGANSHLLARSVDGVAYPYWGDRFGWRDIGARTDVLAGRTITTVFYADARGRQIGYSIAGGAPLPSRGGALRNAGGVRFRVLGGGAVLTWTRSGHTCVLSGAGVSTSTLLSLASWRGEGAILL